MAPFVIDGSQYDGGGQFLRIVVGLSALTKQAIHITNIRQGRSNTEAGGVGYGGIKNHDLVSCEWLADACQARTQNMEAGSTWMVFEPGEDTSRTLPKYVHSTLPSGLQVRRASVALGAPGAISLVFQAILPYLLFVPQQRVRHSTRAATPPLLVTVHGGTHFWRSPTVSYIEHCLIPNLMTLFKGEPGRQPRLSLPCEADRTNVKRSWLVGEDRSSSAEFLIHPMNEGDILNAFAVPPLASFQTGKLQTSAKDYKLRLILLAPSGSTDLLDYHAHQALAIWFPEVDFETFAAESSGHEDRYYALVILKTPKGYRIASDYFFEQKFYLNKKDNAEVRAHDVIECACRGLANEMIRGGMQFDRNMRDQLTVFMGLAKGRSVVQPPGEKVETIREWEKVVGRVGQQRWREAYARDAETLLDVDQPEHTKQTEQRNQSQGADVAAMERAYALVQARMKTQPPAAAAPSKMLTPAIEKAYAFMQARIEDQARAAAAASKENADQRRAALHTLSDASTNAAAFNAIPTHGNATPSHQLNQTPQTERRKEHLGYAADTINPAWPYHPLTPAPPTPAPARTWAQVANAPTTPQSAANANPMPAIYGPPIPSSALSALLAPTTPNVAQTPPPAPPQLQQKRITTRQAADTNHLVSARYAVAEMLGVVWDEDGNCEGVGRPAG